MIRFLFAIVVLFAEPARAAAIMQNGNYVRSWTDLSIEWAGIDLEIERTYNSRSNFDGMFGIGWCSSFETKVATLPDGRLEVTECGGGQTLVYATEDYTELKYSAALDTIVNAVQSTNPDMSDALREELREDLRQSELLYRVVAQEYGVSYPPELNKVYYQTDSPLAQIVYNGKAFERRLGSGWMQEFDRKGRLVRIVDVVGNYQTLHYSNNRLNQISDNFERTITFEYDDNTGKVQRITGPDGVEVNYVYSEYSELIEANNAFGDAYTYEYDSLYNMSKIGFPDNTTELMEYDVERDWIVRFVNRQGCVEDYEYVGDEPLKYSSTAVKTCDGRVVARAAFEYVLDQAEGGGSYLSELSSDENGSRETIYFVPGFNRVSQRVSGNGSEHFRYLSDGRIVQHLTPGRSRYFDYMSVCPGPTSIVTKDDTAKEFDRVWLSYDTETCGVTHVASSSGMTMQASYDRVGKLRQIRTGNGLEVEIDYDESNAEPSLIRSGGMPDLVLNRNEFGLLDVAAQTRSEGAEAVIATVSDFVRLTELDASKVWVGGCRENRSALLKLVEELNANATDQYEDRSEVEQELEASPGIERCSP